MTKLNIGSLVILEEKKIVGIVTETDFISKIIAKALDSEHTTIEEIMIKEVVTIEAGKELEDACSLMVEHEIKHLPVLEKGSLIGILTATDLISVQPKLIENLAKLMLMKPAQAVAG